MRDVDRYLVSARQAGLSLATVTQYGWHLRRLAAWLAGRGVGRVRCAGRDLLREWGSGLYDAWSPATVKQAVCAARAFLRWAHAEGLAEDLGDCLKVPNVPRRVQRTIGLEEFNRLVASCDGSVKGCRDGALMALLVDTGLRASEVCRLALHDLDVEHTTLVVQVKGGNHERAFFGGTTARRLLGWLEVRPMVAVAGVGAVFVSVGGNTPGRALTTRGLRSVVKGRGEALGIAGVSPHSFRRGLAVIATLAGAPSRAVQAAGRWGNIREVERYTLSWQARALYERWSPVDYAENEGNSL